MGNTNSNPKYHSKASALNIIGDDSWTHLKKKWSNLPDCSVNINIFHQIIRLSYESVPKNLCERLFLGFVNDLGASIYVSHFLSTLAVVFGDDQVTLMKFLARVYCNRKHANINGELIVTRQGCENILKLAYESSVSKEQIAAQLDELFLSPSGNVVQSIPCGDVEQFSGSVLLLTNWIKSLLYTCFIETYYPSFSNNALTLLDKKYSTAFEIKEFLSKFDDLQNKLPICHHIRQLYYSKCQLVLPVQPRAIPGTGPAPSSDMIIQLGGKKIELLEASWLEWMVGSKFLNSVVATTVFRLHVNGIKRAWRFYDFAEFCMIFSETNSILDSPDNSSTGISGMRHTSCLFSVEDRVGYICTAFHFRYCAPLLNHLGKVESLPRAHLFGETEAGVDADPPSRARASTVGSEYVDAEPVGSQAAATAAVLNKFLIEHNMRARHTTVGVAASVAALDPRTNILQLNYVRDKCIFHFYDDVYTSCLILHSSLLQTAAVQALLEGLDTDECRSMVMKYYMRRMVLSLFCPCSPPSPRRIKRYRAIETAAAWQSRRKVDIFNSLISERDYGHILSEEKHYRDRVNSRGEINEDGGVSSCLPMPDPPSSAEGGLASGTQTGAGVDDDAAKGLFEEVTVISLPKDLEDELVALELYQENPSLVDYEKLLSKHYDVIPQFNSLSLLVHCEFGLSPSTRQLEKQFITELLLKYQQEHEINRAQPYGAEGTEWCVISKSWFDQWQMFAGQIHFPYNNTGSRSGGRAKSSTAIPAIERPAPLSNWAVSDAGAAILRQQLRHGSKGKIDMLDGLDAAGAPYVVQQPLLQGRLIIGQHIDLVPPPVYKALYHWYSNPSTSSSAGGGDTTAARAKSSDSRTRSKSGEAASSANVAASFVDNSDLFMVKCHVTKTMVSPEAFDVSANATSGDEVPVRTASPRSSLGVEMYPLIVHIGTIDPYSGKESSTFELEVMCYRGTPVQHLLDYARTRLPSSASALQDSKSGGILSLPVPTGHDRLWYCGVAPSSGANSSSNMLYRQHYVLEPDHSLNRQIASVALNAEGVTGRNNSRNTAEDYVFMYLLYECEYSQPSEAVVSTAGKKMGTESSAEPYWPRFRYIALLQQQEKEDEKRLQMPNIDYNYFSSTASSLMSNVMDTAAGIISSPSTGAEGSAQVALGGAGSSKRFYLNPHSFSVGLDNLGNTCYMNSSLQVLLHTPPLVDYFLSQMHLLHLTRTPAQEGAAALAKTARPRQKGYFGELCKLYNALLLEMWAVRAEELDSLKSNGGKPKVRSMSPRVFRKELLGLVRRAGNCDSSSFALHEQHDAQEFLSFLLDNLSDDLSWKVAPKATPATVAVQDDAMPAASASEEISETISALDNLKSDGVVNSGQAMSAPVVAAAPAPVKVAVPADYIEQPDSNDVKYKGIAPEELDTMLADIWWGNHFKRDISIVQTLFLGQYKSKMHCKVCRYASCRYETFNFLSLPIISPKAPAAGALAESATRGLVLHIVPIQVTYIIQCYVDLPSTDTVADLVQLAKDFQLKEVDGANTFEVTEFVKNRICAMYPRSRRISKIKEHACLYLFEVPDQPTPGEPPAAATGPEGTSCEVDTVATIEVTTTETSTAAVLSEGTVETTSDASTPANEGVAEAGSVANIEEADAEVTAAEVEVQAKPETEVKAEVAAEAPSADPIGYSPEERLHRVVFTQRRVRLTSIYDGIEKYLIEPFGVPLMVLLPGRVTVGELYDAISARVNKYLKAEALQQLAAAAGAELAVTESGIFDGSSLSISRSVPSSRGLGLGAITNSSSAYYAFSSSRKRMCEYKMKMQQQSLEEYYAIGGLNSGKGKGKVKDKGKGKGKAKSSEVSGASTPSGKSVAEGDKHLSRVNSPQPNFDDSFDYAMSADIGDLASSMEATKVSAVTGGDVGVGDEEASVCTDDAGYDRSRANSPMRTYTDAAVDVDTAEPLIQPALSLNSVFAGSSINGYGFTIRFIDVSGNNCSLCPWFAKCDGCAIVPSPNNRDEIVEVRDGETLAIDWHLAVYEELLDSNATNSMKNHESMANRVTKQQLRLLQQKKSREQCGVSLYACLDKEFREEEDLDDIVCPTCKEGNRIKKQFRLHRTPPVLIVQLKRFQYDMYGSGRKLGTHIEFPVDDLSLANYMGDDGAAPASVRGSDQGCAAESSEEAEGGHAPRTDAESVDSVAAESQYQLYGVIHHIGMLGGGHYIATARPLVGARDGKETTHKGGVTGSRDDRQASPIPPEVQTENNTKPTRLQRKYRNGIQLGKIVRPVTDDSEPGGVDSTAESNALLHAAFGEDADVSNDSSSEAPSRVASTSPVPRPSPPPSPEKKDKAPAAELKWFCYNDNIVTEVPQHEVVAPSAYLLFYLRKDIVGADVNEIMNRRDIVDHIDAEFVKLNDLDKEVLPFSDTGRKIEVASTSETSDTSVPAITSDSSATEPSADEATRHQTKVAKGGKQKTPSGDGKSAPQECAVC